MSLLDYKKDTDADWEEIARHNPYWGVLAHDKFLTVNLSSAAIDEFFQSGKEHIDKLIRDLDIPADLELGAVLDFGSGVGRLLIPMAKHARAAVGIEISKSMTAELNKNLKRCDVKNTKVYSTCDEMLLKSSVKTFDWINSSIVFQHIPPESGFAILEKLLAALNIGGYISLHFNIFKTKSSFSTAAVFQQTDSRTLSALYMEKDDNRATMQMYDYDFNKIYYLLLKYGIGEFRCVSEAHQHCRTVNILGQKRKTTMIPVTDEHVFLHNFRSWASDVDEMHGFSNAESWGTWTKSKEAYITFSMLPDFYDKELEMKIVLRAFLDTTGRQSVKIFANGKNITGFTIDDPGDIEYNFSIPSGVIKNDNLLTIELKIGNPVSPSELGVSNDGRKLGVGILEMEVM